MTTVEVAGDSMIPVYKSGEDLVVTKLTTGVNRGDIVYFKFGQNTSLKRIIGLPNDKIRIYQGSIFINDDRLTENYLVNQNFTKAGSFLREGEDFIIPEGNYVLIGDNRKNSNDSRDLGFVPSVNIIGKIWFCFMNCD